MFFFKLRFDLDHYHSLLVRPFVSYSRSLSPPSSGSVSSVTSAFPRPSRFSCAALGMLSVFAVPCCAAPSASADPAHHLSNPLKTSQPTVVHNHIAAQSSALVSSAALVRSTSVPPGGTNAKAAAHAPLLLTLFAENGLPTHTRPTEIKPADAVGASMSPLQTRFDFGSVSSLSPAQHVQMFFLRNDNKVPVTVSQLQSSSGCLQAAFAASEPQTASSAASPTSGLIKRTALHQLLPPGQQIPLHVTLNSVAMAPGAVDQSLWVFVEGQAMPAATLKVTGTLQPLLQFSPKVLDFGITSAADKGSPGKKSLALTMTLDSQLTAGGLQPQVVCSNPDIKINLVSTTAVSSSISGNAASSAGAATSLPVSRPVVQTYSVQLSPNAALGTLKSRLIFSFMLPARSQFVPARLQTAASQPALPKGALQDAVLVIIPVTGAVTK